MRAEQTKLTVFVDGLAVFIDGVLLTQGVAHAHDHAALDLPLTGFGVHGLAHVVGGHHFFKLSGLPVQDAQLRCIAIGHVRDRIRHVCAKLVGFGQILAIELASGKRGQVAGERFVKFLTCAAAGLACDQRLARAGGIARVGCNPRVRALIDDLLTRERRVGHHHLHQHGAYALPDTRRTGVDVELAVAFHDQLASAPVGKSHANARVFHRTGQTNGLSGFDGGIKIILYGLKRFHQAGLRAHDLSVWQYAARADGVAAANLPRRNADDLGHFIQHRLNGKARLRHAEAAECARRRVVGVIGRALDLKILIGIGAGRMGTRALKHGAAQRGKRARVRGDARLDAKDFAVFVAAHGEVHPERMALGMNQERFGARELDLDRTAGTPGGQRRVVLHRHVLFSAKAAADQLIFDLDLLAAQHQRTLMQGGVRRLVGGENHHVVVCVDIGNRALRLKEGVLGPRRFKVARDHMCGRGNGRVGISARDMLIRLNICGLLVKDQRRIGRGGLDGIVYGGENLILDPDQLLRLFHRFGVLGHDQTDRVAKIVCQTADGNQRVLVVLDVADLIFARDILSRQDGNHTGQRFCFGCVDRQHPRARIFAAHGRGIAHAVQIHIVGIFAIALYLFRHIQPVDAFAQRPAVL